MVLTAKHHDSTGPVFDSANGEGPNGRREAYDGPRVYRLARRLQPEPVIFSGTGPEER